MVAIIQKTDHEMFVNNKRVYKDGSGNWITSEELTRSEEKAFQLHIKD